MFRGKESSNRIELSRLVQDLLNFGVLGSLRLWGWGMGWWGWLVVGGAPTHVHMHVHTCTCVPHTHTHGKHDNFMQMAASIGFLGDPWEFPMMSCMCTCMRACAWVCTCVGGTLSPPSTPMHPPPPPHPPGGRPSESVKNSIALELIEIFQFCLKIWNLWRLPHPWVGV